MFVIRNVFRCKPGQAKNLIDKFKAAAPAMQKIAKQKIMVDEVAAFWTVVVEVETEDIAIFEKVLNERRQDKSIQDAMSGYMDHIDSGYREIFKIVA
jgi:heme-degrading monooxygenase HmoA